MYEGGVYNAFYGSPLQAFSIEEGVFGMYVKSSPRIDFLREFSSLASPPRMEAAGYGMLNNREMTLHRDPFGDYPVELYVQR